MTVMVRPMSGMHALAEQMRRMLEAAGWAARLTRPTARTSL